MRKKREPKFTWDESTGVATCTLQYGNQIFIGTATCCFEDLDMISEKTGCNIALARARIKYYLYLRDNEARPALKAFTHLYNTMINSKKFNPKSYEAIMLRRQIVMKQDDVDLLNSLLISEKSNLKRMLEEKDKFYKRIRANRSKGKDE